MAAVNIDTLGIAPHAYPIADAGVATLPVPITLQDYTSQAAPPMRNLLHSNVWSLQTVVNWAEFHEDRF